ncbi:hypothetical protein SprV_0200738400 [Sparganum proliferum]
MALKAEEVQGYADHDERKNVFAATNAVYGPPTKGTAPLINSDGSMLLPEKSQILKRCAEHVRSVLNRSSTISDAAIDRLLQGETNAALDHPPSLSETIRAVHRLASGKSPGSDAIPAEVFNHDGYRLMDHLMALFQEMWGCGQVPRISRTQQSFISSGGKKTGNFVTVTEASRREDLRSHPPQPTQRPSETRTFTGTPVRLPATPCNDRHDFCRLPVAREVSGDANSSSHHSRGPDEGL